MSARPSATMRVRWNRGHDAGVGSSFPPQRDTVAFRRLFVVSVLVVACESTSAPEPPVYERDVTPEMLTGAALAALSAGGRFTLSHPPTLPGEVGLDSARIQSLGFARYVTNQLLLRGVVEGERGGIWTDPHLLDPCGDAYFVRSQLGEVPDSAGPAALKSFHRRFGPQWVIPFCGSQLDPQMTVQAAVSGNDIRFADGAPIEPYTDLTSAWYARGIPNGWPDPLTISPERAARFTWETFGVRVSEVPELFVRGVESLNGQYTGSQVGSTRFCHRWRVTLESEVRIRGMTTFTEVATRVVWVAALTCGQHDVEPYLHLPRTEQPTTVLLAYADGATAPRHVQTPITVPVRFEIGSKAP